MTWPSLCSSFPHTSMLFCSSTDTQVEGAQKVHIEEARLRFDMAIGKMAPVTEDEILLHLREFAGEVNSCSCLFA